MLILYGVGKHVNPVFLFNHQSNGPGTRVGGLSLQMGTEVPGVGTEHHQAAH